MLLRVPILTTPRDTFLTDLYLRFPLSASKLNSARGRIRGGHEKIPRRRLAEHITFLLLPCPFLRTSRLPILATSPDVPRFPQQTSNYRRRTNFSNQQIHLPWPAIKIIFFCSAEILSEICVRHPKHLTFPLPAR